MKKSLFLILAFCVSNLAWAQPSISSVAVSPSANNFSDPYKNWGFYNTGDIGTEGPSLFDTSLGETDDFGIIPSGYGQGYFYGISELANAENPSGTGSITLDLDIAGAGNLESISIDMGAMGQFELGEDEFDWRFSIDGFGPIIAFDIDANTSATQYYKLADGTIHAYNSPLDAVIGNGGGTVRLDNNLKTLTYNFPSGWSGNTLTLEFTARQTGGAEAYAFDNINITTSTGTLNLGMSDNSFIGVTLPVEFGNLAAQQVGSDILIKWETLRELNSDYMAVERSHDGLSFEEIGRTPGADISEQAITYQFNDQTPALGNNIYRIRQVDFDGSFSYSASVEVSIKPEEWLQILPNRVSDVLQLHAQEAVEADWTLQIFNVENKLMTQNTMEKGSIVKNIETTNYPAGIYFLKAEAGNSLRVLKFVKE
ncbi:MAG: T9SS type A sorting domain-containing protein [Bacteroidota bacterium]